MKKVSETNRWISSQLSDMERPILIEAATTFWASFSCTQVSKKLRWWTNPTIMIYLIRKILLIILSVMIGGRSASSTSVLCKRFRNSLSSNKETFPELLFMTIFIQKINRIKPLTKWSKKKYKLPPWLATAWYSAQVTNSQVISLRLHKMLEHKRYLLIKL